MSLVVVQLSPPPGRTGDNDADDESHPTDFEAEVIADLDALAESHKCSCNAGGQPRPKIT